MSDPRTTPSIFTRGAVDLGALRPSTGAAAKHPAAGSTSAASPGAPAAGDSGAQGFGANGASAPAQAAQGGAGGAVVIDVTEATFSSEVMERSMTTPVVLDFWAEWCGPCKQLSPVLEKLAVEGGGSWVLAKIDVDTNPRLAQMFRVQGIPMVYAVVAGQPVDAFTGVVPEPQLRQWIDAVLKTAGVDAAVPEDPMLTAADDALMSGDLESAEQAYRKILNERPMDHAAEAGLAQVGLLRRVSGVNPADVLAKASANPVDVAAQLLAADVEAATGHADRAYTRLIELVRTTFGDDRDTIRKHLVSLFSVADPDDPAVAAARRALASALF